MVMLSHNLGFLVIKTVFLFLVKNNKVIMSMRITILHFFIP